MSKVVTIESMVDTLVHHPVRPFEPIATGIPVAKRRFTGMEIVPGTSLTPREMAQVDLTELAEDRHEAGVLVEELTTEYQALESLIQQGLEAYQDLCILYRMKASERQYHRASLESISEKVGLGSKIEPSTESIGSAMKTVLNAILKALNATIALMDRIWKACTSWMKGSKMRNSKTVQKVEEVIRQAKAESVFKIAIPNDVLVWIIPSDTHPSALTNENAGEMILEGMNQWRQMTRDLINLKTVDENISRYLADGFDPDDINDAPTIEVGDLHPETEVKEEVDFRRVKSEVLPNGCYFESYYPVDKPDVRDYAYGKRLAKATTKFHRGPKSKDLDKAEFYLTVYAVKQIKDTWTRFNEGTTLLAYEFHQRKEKLETLRKILTRTQLNMEKDVKDHREYWNSRINHLNYVIKTANFPISEYLAVTSTVETAVFKTMANMVDLAKKA